MSPAGSPVVRDAVPEDLPETLDLLFANWRQTYAPLIGAAAVERLLVDQHSVEVLQTQLDARPVAFLSALLDGRLAPSTDDVLALARPVLSHRMALSFAARARGENLAVVIEGVARDVTRAEAA